MVYIVEKVTVQTNYTEPRYYASARDAEEILFADTDEEKAMAFMTAIEPYEEGPDDDEEDPYYYRLLVVDGSRIKDVASRKAEDAQR